MDIRMDAKLDEKEEEIQDIKKDENQESNINEIQETNIDEIHQTKRDEIQHFQLRMLQDYVEIMLGKDYMRRIIRSCRRKEGTNDNAKVATFLNIVKEKGADNVTKRDLDITLLMYLLNFIFQKDSFDIGLSTDEEYKGKYLKYTKKAFYRYLSGIRYNRNGISHISDISEENREHIHELQVIVLEGVIWINTKM